MRIFGFLFTFFDKNNITNSARICLLFRRKGIHLPWDSHRRSFSTKVRSAVTRITLWRNSKQSLGGNLNFRFYVLASKTDFFEVKKDNKKMKFPLSIIFEKNAKQEKIIVMRIFIFLIFLRQNKIKNIQIRIGIIFEKNGKINKSFYCGFLDFWTKKGQKKIISCLKFFDC